MEEYLWDSWPAREEREYRDVRVNCLARLKRPLLPPHYSFGPPSQALACLPISACVTLTGRRLSKAPLARVSLPVHLPRAPFILPHPSLSSLPRRAVPPPLLLGQPNGPWVPRDGVLAAQDHRQTVKNSGNFQVRFSRCPGLQNNAKMKLEKRRACMTFTFSCANAVFVCLQRERPFSRMMRS